MLNTDKTLPKNSQNLSKQSNGLLVFNITEQTVLVQSVYVKQVSWESLYLSATLAGDNIILKDKQNILNKFTIVVNLKARENLERRVANI